MGSVPITLPLFLCDYCHRGIKDKALTIINHYGLVLFFCSQRCVLLDKLKRSK